MDLFFNLYKIRFNILEKLIPGCCTTLKQDSKINIYINLEPIIRKMIASGIDTELKVRNEERVIEFISCVFNIAAHYRLFFAKHKLHSNVYIYYGYPFDSRYINKDINPEYRDNTTDLMLKNPKARSVRTVINDAIPLLKTILEYIEGVYFIESDSVEPSLIPYNFYKDNEDKFHFLVTTDRYEYQYATLDNFYVLRPKVENSYILYRGNIIDQMKYEDKIVTDITTKPEMVSFILSILGSENRNIPKIKRMGLASIIKLIQKGVEKGLISDSTNNIFILSKVIKDDYLEQIMSNYMCTDLETQYGKLKSKDFYIINNQIIDKFDNNHLKKLNDVYFNRYPLFIMEIQAALKLKKQERVRF